MDEDLIFIIAFFSFLILFPFGIILSVNSCIAAARTRAWKKKQAAEADNIEAEPLNREEEDDFLDTEDEEDYHAQKAEEQADKHLTTRQKFRKEFKKAWKGNVKDAQKQREREERRKLAKAVAREVERRERRRARQEQQAGGSSNEVEGLPSYNNAVASDRKE